MAKPKVNEILAKLIGEVPQFIAADCADLETGSSVSEGTSIDRNLDPTMASGSYSEVLQANARALDFLGVGSDAFEDIVVTARDAFILVRPLGARHFVSLVLTRRGNLSLARAALAKYESALLEALSEGD